MWRNHVILALTDQCHGGILHASLPPSAEPTPSCALHLSLPPFLPRPPRRLNVDRLVLRQDALARWTLIHRSLGAKKPVPAKKSRKWGVTTKSA